MSIAGLVRITNNDNLSFAHGMPPMDLDTHSYMVEQRGMGKLLGRIKESV